VVSGLSGQSWTLVRGLATALWSGTEVVRAAQCAFNSVWEVPYHERPGLAQRLVTQCLGAGHDRRWACVYYDRVRTHRQLRRRSEFGGGAGGYVLAAALDVRIFIAALRLLTDRDVNIREVPPGASYQEWRSSCCRNCRQPVRE
jgi:membrane protein